MSTKRTRTRIAPLGSVAAAAMLLAAGASPAAAASGTGEFAATHPEAGPLALASAAVAAVAGGYGLKLMRRRQAEDREQAGTVSPEPPGTEVTVAAQQAAAEPQLTAQTVNSAG
ncbi:hypothetical protein [Streptomyces indicus]|uniref:PEP-CTERM protein-sorting domain-containing protein n=1 Tax=Streptomyces indicus TaxID=417292 RepID=A0A1G9HDG0_9ACTN|nr:hypothetical protein [Streptomyces indicus]SDL10885.1 hypothetical protein SAMN05421806_118133 [Streptomyces indicus]